MKSKSELRTIYNGMQVLYVRRIRSWGGPGPGEGVKLVLSRMRWVAVGPGGRRRVRVRRASSGRDRCQDAERGQVLAGQARVQRMVRGCPRGRDRKEAVDRYVCSRWQG